MSLAVNCELFSPFISLASTNLELFCFEWPTQLAKEFILLFRWNNFTWTVALRSTSLNDCSALIQPYRRIHTFDSNDLKLSTILKQRTVQPLNIVRESLTEFTEFSSQTKIIGSVAISNGPLCSFKRSWKRSGPNAFQRDMSRFHQQSNRALSSFQIWFIDFPGLS